MEYDEATEELFENVETFTDLQNVYVKFLKGEIQFSPDHLTPVTQETIPMLDDLIKINKLVLLLIVVSQQNVNITLMIIIHLKVISKRVLL